VAVNVRQRVDLQLAVGDVKETVTVNGAASVVEADSSERGHVMAYGQNIQMR